MGIPYKETHDLRAGEFEDLFLSVEWSSGHYSDRLAVAMRSFETVYTAWDGEKPVGLLCAMDDGGGRRTFSICRCVPHSKSAGLGSGSWK